MSQPPKWAPLKLQWYVQQVNITCHLQFRYELINSWPSNRSNWQLMSLGTLPPAEQIDFFSLLNCMNENGRNIWGKLSKVRFHISQQRVIDVKKLSVYHCMNGTQWYIRKSMNGSPASETLSRELLRFCCKQATRVFCAMQGLKHITNVRCLIHTAEAASAKALNSPYQGQCCHAGQ